MADLTVTVQSQTISVTITSTTLGLPSSTAESDFIVSDSAFSWVKKTLAQVKTILGLGTAAYTAATAYVTHALATAAEDFLVASGAGAFVKKTRDETRQILVDGFVTGSSNYSTDQTVNVATHKDYLYYYITGSMAFNITGAVDGDAGMLIFIIDGIGGYTVTMGTGWDYCIGGSTSGLANKRNVVSWRCCGSDIYYTIAQNT